KPNTCVKAPCAAVIDVRVRGRVWNFTLNQPGMNRHYSCYRNKRRAPVLKERSPAPVDASILDAEAAIPNRLAANFYDPARPATLFLLSLESFDFDQCPLRQAWLTVSDIAHDDRIADELCVPPAVIEGPFPQSYDVIFGN